MKIKKLQLLKKMNRFSLKQNEKKLILLIFIPSLFIASLFAQDNLPINVSGFITDQNGETMVGVNVVVNKTTNGTVSNIDGRFSLTVNANDTLSISFIGFETQLIPIKGRTLINIKLFENNTDLDEVVVVGYGEVKRANLLGSVSSIAATEIEDYVAPSLTQLLDSRLPGVHVSQRQPSGNPATATQIRIRAETSFGLSGQLLKDLSPLFIVDGFEITQENYDMLDPSEIESFSVLKDASAAVYGSKGANGVILVKTKRGKEGKLRISYSGSIGVGDATRHVELMSAYDHIRTINARYPDDTTRYVSPEEVEAMRDLDYNWLDDIWKKATWSRHTLNFSGGSNRVRYYAGGSFVYTDANFPQMGYGKYSLRFGLDANITDNLSVSATISMDDKDYIRPNGGGYGVQTSPRWKPAFINGLPVANGSSAPLYEVQLDNYTRTSSKGNSLNLNVSYDFAKIKGLKASASFSRRETHGYLKNYDIPYTIYEFGHPEGFLYILNDEVVREVTVKGDNRVFERYTTSQNYQLNLSLNYSKTFGKHKLGAFATYEQSEASGFQFQAVTEEVQTYGLELQDAFLTTDTHGTMSEGGDYGGVFRLNYSFSDKYLLESTLRYETTTKFSPGERKGLFPSVSVGWVASQEDFFKDNVSFINFMKIRFSMGLSGFASVAAYEYLRKYSVASDQYLLGSNSPVVGLSIGGKTDVISSGVSWEKSLMHNLGIDLKFLDNKLSFSMDGFYTYQYDILDQRTVEFAETAGLGDLPGENIGRLEAWGFDGNISYRGKINKDVFWKISTNFEFATNRIIEKPTQYPENDFRYPIGRSTYALDLEQGFIDHGIIRTQEQLDAINAEWNVKWGHDYIVEGRPIVLGTFFYEDIGREGNTAIGEPRTVFEPDGNINEYDKKYLERVNDKFSWKHLMPGNLSLSAGWKDLRVSTNWSMAYGFWNTAVDKSSRMTADYDDNVPSYWADFWTPENPNAKYPNPYKAKQNQWVSTFWMKDVYELRLKNLNVSYTIPTNISKKWGVNNLRIFISATNLWTPIETFKYKDDALSSYNGYPIQKTFNLGVNLKI